jgi:hypothetical protein
MRHAASAVAALSVIALASCAIAPSSPSAQDPVLITLQRTPCFGFCPDYVVSIDGDGKVAYNGGRFVGVSGPQHGKASQQDVEALLRAFDALHFETLHDAYRANVTDLPSQIITLTRNGHTKRVVDYAGASVGMPQAVTALEIEIDRVANTAQWVRGPGGSSQKSGKPSR